MTTTIRAVLRDRDAALYLTGVVVSGFGTSALWLVSGVWVKDLTGSDGLAALCMLAMWAPTLAGPLLGTLADRFPRRPLLIASSLFLAALLPVLLAVDSPGLVWLVLGVLLVYGATGVVNDAAEAALVANTLPATLLGDFNGLRMAITEGMKLVSPLAGAGLYTLYGGPAVVLLDAATFVVAAGVYAGLRGGGSIGGAAGGWGSRGWASRGWGSRGWASRGRSSRGWGFRGWASRSGGPRQRRTQAQSTPLSTAGPAPSTPHPPAGPAPSTPPSSAGPAPSAPHPPAGPAPSTPPSSAEPAPNTPHPPLSQTQNASPSPHRATPPTPPTPRRRLRALLAPTTAGARHLWAHPRLRPLVLAGGFSMLCAGLNGALFYAVIDGLGHSPSYAGVLYAVQGAGSVSVGLLSGQALRWLGERRFAAWGIAVTAVAVALRAVPSDGVALLSSAAIGAGLPCVLIAALTAVQRETPDAVLGRTVATANTLVYAPNVIGLGAGAGLVELVDHRPVLVVLGVTWLAVGSLLLRGGRGERAVR
ncbi:MFS transporter [Streptomyces niveiscabiei]|uniref:MFS transporter n=1 Tax=Streptomyces niveiscabiei TaxID=164115 RepID=A0ABW9HWQ7_9ACTN